MPLGDPRRDHAPRRPDLGRDHSLGGRRDAQGRRRARLPVARNGRVRHRCRGLPLDQAAEIEVEEVRRHLAEESGLERVVFAVRGEDAVTAFQRALGNDTTARPDERDAEILRRVRSIPPGFVSTYGDLCPEAPRHAGAVLAHTHERDLPWHQVVQADGSLAVGDRQRKLLEAEGVPFRGGQVDMRRIVRG